MIKVIVAERELLQTESRRQVSGQEQAVCRKMLQFWCRQGDRPICTDRASVLCQSLQSKNMICISCQIFRAKLYSDPSPISREGVFPGPSSSYLLFK